MTYRGLVKNSQNTSLKKGRINRKKDARDIRVSQKKRMLSDANYAIN